MYSVIGNKSADDDVITTKVRLVKRWAVFPKKKKSRWLI